MRILFINNYYPPYEVGGLEQLCRDVATAIADRGHDTHVLVSTRGVQADAERDESIVSRWLQLSPNYESTTPVPVQFLIDRKRVEHHNSRQLQRVMHEFRPDVIFFWNIQCVPRTLALEAEALGEVPVAYWLAGYSPAEPDEYWLYWNYFPKKTIARILWPVLRWPALAILRHEGKPLHPEMKRVAVVSEFMREKGIAEGTLPTHAEVIYNGVEVDTFYHPVQPRDVPLPLKLLYAGRVSRDKGVHTTIEALGHLSNTIEDPQSVIHLLIAGHGPTEYLHELQSLVDTLNLRDLISFRGWLPREQMPELMRTCHVLLLPTTHPEPFARVALEGMAAGLVVIGTLTGGTGELLEGDENGLTFAAGDSMTLARQIARLLDDPDLRYRLAQEGQRNVLERYSMDRMVEEILGFLESVVAEGGEQNGF